MTTKKGGKSITFKEFLEEVPPGREVEVSNAFSQHGLIGPPPPIVPVSSGYYSGPEPDLRRRKLQLVKPQLSLYCDNIKCKGVRYFSPCGTPEALKDGTNNMFITYSCKNCVAFIKTFALRIVPLKSKAKVFKFGEVPAFGPPTPARAITIIGPDKDLFLNGRRAENQGMGIGAFAYYRRVVENQKNRIFDEVIRATNSIAPNDPVIQELENAKNETQFTKAIETIKHALPQSLLIKDKNPLNLLHSALSKGIHDLPDPECLELASDIRTILFEFAEKLGQTLKNKTELDAAVKRLAGKKNVKKLDTMKNK